MLFEHKIINVDSFFHLGLSIPSNGIHKLNEYLTEQLKIFTDDLALDYYNLIDLSFDKLFTDVEFNIDIVDEKDESFINKHFYPKLFADLWKFDNGKLDYKIRYCFTLDKSLVTDKSSSGICYGVLLLGNKPVLYYIWVDTQKLIDLLKSI